MRIIPKENSIILENTVKDGEHFSLNIYPNNIPSIGKEPRKVGFLLVYPKDCIIEHFSENSIIIWRNVPEEEE